MQVSTFTRFGLAMLAATIMIGTATTASADVSWIDAIQNNTDHKFVMWSNDSRNNGAFYEEAANGSLGEKLGDNDWDHKFTIPAQKRILCQWCGIPWYYQSRQHRGLAKINSGESAQAAYDSERGLLFWQSQTDDGNGIRFSDKKTRAKIKKDGSTFELKIGRGDRHFELHINPVDETNPAGDFRVTLVLMNTDTLNQDIVDALTKFASDQYEDYREIRKEVAGAVAGAVTGG